MVIRMIIGAVIGGLSGYLYYKMVGCSTGACPITSNRYSSTIYGALIGLSFASSF